MDFVVLVAVIDITPNNLTDSMIRGLIVNYSKVNTIELIIRKSHFLILGLIGNINILFSI